VNIQLSSPSPRRSSFAESTARIPDAPEARETADINHFLPYGFDFHGFQMAMDMRTNGVQWTNNNVMNRFHRVGTWRIPTGEVSRIDPTVGLRVEPELEREDLPRFGQEHTAQPAMTFEALTAERPNPAEAHAPEILDERDDRDTVDSPELAEEYFPPDYEHTPHETQMIIDEDEVNEPHQGDGDEDAPEDSENAEAAGSASATDGDDGGSASGGGAGGQPSGNGGGDGNEPADVDGDNDEDGQDAQDADEDAASGDEDEDEEDGQGQGDADDDNDSEDENDDETDESDEDEDEQPAPQRANVVTQNPQTGDNNLALLGLAVSSVGFVSSSLILFIVVLERKARGK